MTNTERRMAIIILSGTASVLGFYCLNLLF